MATPWPRPIQHLTTSGGSSDFKALPQCSPDQEHCNQQYLSDALSHPQFLLWALRDVPGLTCPLSSAKDPSALNSDFYLYTARLPALLDFYIGYKNVDLTYLYFCESGRSVQSSRRQLHAATGK